MVKSSSDFVFYHYVPSLPAAAFFAAFFGLSALLHFYQFFRTRTMYMIPLLIAGLFEFVGYVARAISHTEAPDYALPPYIVQSILILIAPALLSASVYMVLGSIILAVDGDSRSPIKKKFLTKIFVLGDICSFLIQSTGASLLTTKKPTPAETASARKAGNYIIIGGLAFQLLFFGLFLVVSILFYLRMHAAPTARSTSTRIPWRKNLYVLYAASLLIMVRSVFRVVEYAQGQDGYLLRREIWLYIFDATLMLLVMLLFNVVHPSEIHALLSGKRAARFLVQMQTTEKLDAEHDGPAVDVESARG